MDIVALAQAEVVARHDFFVAWFTGRSDDTAMDATARAFAPDMQMIPPDGKLATAPQVIAMLRSARNSRGDDFAIRIEFISARKIGDWALVVYDEHQSTDSTTSQRRSTALFSADATAPTGVVWQHLQETWT
tara:strand:- start:142344 stop:142739 length:396 start_codon:yes stop_codon:yes gene_type:complete